MSQRTQMRLHAITGSLSAIDAVASSPAVAADISAGNLQDILGQFAGAIRRIHGADDFTNQAAGIFTHENSQFSGVLTITGALDANSSADFEGAVQMQSTLNVDSLATVSGSVVEDLEGGANAVLFADGSGRVKSDAKLTWDGSTLSVDGALDLTGGIVGSSLVAGRMVYVDADGALTTESGLDYDAAQDVLGVSGSVKVGGGYGADGIDLKDNGDIDMDGRLLVDGDALVSGSLKVGADDFTVDAAGNVFAAGTLDVDGQATLASVNVEDLTATRVVFVGASGELVDDVDLSYSAAVLTVSGSTFGKDVSIVQDLSVGRNLTITGDLLVQGDTVTINVGEIVAEDKHIVLAKVDGNISDDTANDGGLILTGSTDHTILWRKNTPGNEAWEFSEHLIPGGVGAKDLGLDGDRWQNLWLTGNADVDGNADIHGTLTVDGLVEFNGHMSASLIKINNDVPERLYIVDADGSIKDEADLTYGSGKLLVNGASGLEVTNAAVMKSTLEVDGIADFDADVYMAEELYVSGGFEVLGASLLKSTLEVDGIADFDADVYAAQDLYLSGAADFASTLAVADHVTLDKADDQSILKTGGDLYMSSSEDLRLHGGKLMKLVDQYGIAASADANDWADAEGIKLSSTAQEWADFQDTFGVGKSIIGALASGGAGGKFVEAVDYTGTIVSASLLVSPDEGAQLFSAKWSTIVEPRVLKTDVFVNGQLMVSGTAIGSPSGVMDYAVDSNGDITFSFGLVPDDIVVVKVG